MNSLLKPIYPSEGEAESWRAYLQRTIWGSPAAIVQDPPEETDLQPQIVQQAAAVAATRPDAIVVGAGIIGLCFARDLPRSATARSSLRRSRRLAAFG